MAIFHSYVQWNQRLVDELNHAFVLGETKTLMRSSVQDGATLQSPYVFLMALSTASRRGLFVSPAARQWSRPCRPRWMQWMSWQGRTPRTGIAHWKWLPFWYSNMDSDGKSWRPKLIIIYNYSCWPMLAPKWTSVNNHGTSCRISMII